MECLSVWAIMVLLWVSMRTMILLSLIPVVTGECSGCFSFYVTRSTAYCVLAAVVLYWLWLRIYFLKWTLFPIDLPMILQIFKGGVWLIWSFFNLTHSDNSILIASFSKFSKPEIFLLWLITSLLLTSFLYLTLHFVLYIDGRLTRPYWLRYTVLSPPLTRALPLVLPEVCSLLPLLMLPAVTVITLVRTLLSVIWYRYWMIQNGWSSYKEVSILSFLSCVFPDVIFLIQVENNAKCIDIGTVVLAWNVKLLFCQLIFHTWICLALSWHLESKLVIENLQNYLWCYG